MLTEVAGSLDPDQRREQLRDTLAELERKRHRIVQVIPDGLGWFIISEAPSRKKETRG